MWIDNNLKIDNVPVLYHSWCEAEICFISDLYDENNEFLSFNRLSEIYGIETNFVLQHVKILHNRPRNWKDRLNLTNNKI